VEYPVPLKGKGGGKIISVISKAFKRRSISH